MLKKYNISEIVFPHVVPQKITRFLRYFFLSAPDFSSIQNLDPRNEIS